MKLSIIGTGYVGIVTGIGFSNLGNDVICHDIDPAKVDQLSKGELTIYEPGLDEIFQMNLKRKRISFTTDMSKAVLESEIIFICVDTPSNEHQEADLTVVKQVAKDIGRYLNGYKIIVNKSTVPVGTAEIVKQLIKENLTENFDFDVVSNPEFLKEGSAVKDFTNPDRIVIGVENKKAEETMVSLYRSLARTGRPIMITGIQSSELIKYASNSMLAARISFMNQLSHLCDKTGADIREVSRGMGLDRRIGSRFLHAGLGYGGSCFPKDVNALISTLKNHGCDYDLFEAVHSINEKQKNVAVEKLKSFLDIKNSRIAIWGIAFKPKTDDIREAPAVRIIKELQELGASINAFDPVAMEKATKVLQDVNFFESPYEAIRDCDAVIIATEWDEFRNLDMRAVKVLLKKPIIIDGRNIYEKQEMEALGITYAGIGR